MNEKKEEVLENEKALKDSKFLIETYGDKKSVDAACKKASISDFASTDPTRLFMNGIFYEKGFAIATNGRILIKLKKSYPAEWEGQIINPTTGTEIDGTFPNYKKVFPDKKNLKDRSSRLANISNYLSRATAGVALAQKVGNLRINIPVVFENTLVDSKYLQLALAFARDKGFNKVYQEDNYETKYESVLDENGNQIYKYYNFMEANNSEFLHKYYSYDELPAEIKVMAETKPINEGSQLIGNEWYYDKVEKRVKEYDKDPSKLLMSPLEFDTPDGSSIIIMPMNIESESFSGPYIDKNGIFRNYEDSISIKTKLLGKNDDFYENIVRNLLEDSDFANADIDNIFKSNLEESLKKQNTDVFPKTKKDCQILATAMTYADAIGKNLDKNDFVLAANQTSATLQQFICNLWIEKFKDYISHPDRLFIYDKKDRVLNSKITIEKAKENNLIKEKNLTKNLFDKPQDINFKTSIYKTIPKDENKLKLSEIREKEDKFMTKKEIVDYYVEHNNERKTGRFHSYASMMIDWKDFVENLYMSDAITEKQKDSLAGPCAEKDFEKFNERFESNVKQKATKEQENDYDETTEIEKLYAEVNPNGGNDRGFQFGVKDLEHLKNIKRLLNNFEKNPPKHSELEDFESKENRYSRESKRLQKIYEKEHDKDALKGAQKNADYANFYHWQVEKLTKDIIQHPDKFDKVKTWYEKAYSTDKKMVEKMSEYVVFGQLESDIESGIGYGQPNASSERYGEYDSIVRERLFKKLAEINNINYDVIYDKWLHAGEEKNQNLNKESSQKNDVDNSQKMSKPMPLDFGHEEKEISNAPFEIIKDERFNRVNIRFDTENKSPHFDEILKELKSNEWKYAPSKKQWYPTNLKNNPDDFAKKLLEKYSESKEELEIKTDETKTVKENDFAEKLSESKKGPYDGIKFFDRNYLETEDFTTYFNKHIDSFGKEKPLLSENDAKYILRALNHLDVGLLEERTDRLGVDNKGQLIIFSKQKDDINITKTDLKGVIQTAKEMSEKSLKQAEEAFEKHSEKNILDDSLKSIFTKMYSECISQCKEVNAHMEEIYTKYNLKKNIERKVKPLSVNDKIGKDSVVDVYNISDGVYQATLSYDSGNGSGSVQNYFIVDSQIAKKCRPEIIELMEERDGRFVVENKNNEPYILKELISKNLMPPRDESFIQKLDEFIEKHPEKYAKLYPIDSFNFSEKLNELANIDKELTKNPLLCGKKLISLVNESEKRSISSFLKRNGCIDDSSMKKVFSEWMGTPQIEKEKQRKIKKNDGYPPRGA